MQPEAAAHIWNASEAARPVRTLTDDKTETDLLADLLSAVERQFEILGESLNRLRRDDPATAARVPDLEKIVGMRNVIAHEYGEVDYEIVWAAVSRSEAFTLSFLFLSRPCRRRQVCTQAA